MKNLLKNIRLIAVLVFFNFTILIAQTWTSLNGPQIAKNVKDIAVSGDVVYIAENDYLLKSTNGGTVWKGTNTIYNLPLLTLCKSDNPDIVLASKKIYLDYNDLGGNGNWVNKIDDPNLTPLRLSISPVNKSNMFLGRKYHASTPSIWRSISSDGAIWDPCDNFRDGEGNFYQTDIYDVAPYPVPGVGRDDELWICGSHPTGQQATIKITSADANVRGIWYSNNAGLNWQPRTMGGYNLRSLVVIHKMPEPYLITVTDNGEIFRSVNYGREWSQVSSTSSTGQMMRVNQNTTPNTVFLATSNGIYRSLDEGASWSTVNSGLGNDLDVLSITIQPNSNTIFAGTTKTIYKSTDNGNSWVDVGKMNVSSFAAYDGNIWSVTRDNNYSGKYDGSNWTTVSIGEAGNGFRSEQVFVKSSTELFITGALNNAAALYRSANSGNSYSQVTISNPSPTSGKFLGTIKHPNINNNKMWLYGGSTINNLWKMLLISNNGGSTWSFPVHPPFWQDNELYVNDMNVLNTPPTSRLFAAISDGKICFSVDDGETWCQPAALEMGESANTIAFNPNIEAIIYAGGNNGLWKSYNYGNFNTWSKINSTVGIINKIILPPSYPNSSDHLIAIVNNGNDLLYSSNGGEKWHDISYNLPKPIIDIKIESNNPHIIYVATNEGVYYYNTTIPTGTTPISPEMYADDIYYTVTLKWEESPDALCYSLQVYDDIPILDTIGIIGTQHTMVGLEFGRDYKWRVSSSNFIFSSEWCEDQIFKTRANWPDKIINETQINGDWNLVSIPHYSEEPEEIYPEFVWRKTNFDGFRESDVFEYYNSIYSFLNEESPIFLGKGHWAKFSKEYDQVYTGYPIYLFPVDVDKGWNIIGSISEEIDVRQITSEPPGIISSPVYKFHSDVHDENYISAGFTLTDKILPGCGYMVKVSEPGRIILDSNAPFYYEELLSFNGLDKFKISDSEGRSQELYICDEEFYENFENIDLNMPPIPPFAEFDARFMSGQIVEPGKPQHEPSPYYGEFIIVVTRGEDPITITWDIYFQSGLTYSIVFIPGGGLGKEQTYKLGKKGSIQLPKLKDGLIKLRAEKSICTEKDIFTYKLMDNYPNPFNPHTIIGYSLADPCNVKLTVYDIVGREVTTLVNEHQTAGYKTVNFNGSNLPSGVYFYRLQAGKYNAAKKMLLVK